ncbi:MAG: hypothetical protein II553_04700, partial [Lachnospiraceae bacterium]|nr:hypothetical protein [Lachnospiraceae bacterium]
KGGDEKKDKLEKNLGKQDYSINIGDNTYDLSWLSPSAMPLFVGVELEKTLKGIKIALDRQHNQEMAFNGNQTKIPKTLKSGRKQSFGPEKTRYSAPSTGASCLYHQETWASCR